jgi:hypothetical protein
MSKDYKTTNKPQASIAPKRVFKDQMTVTHDLFKLLPATMKKNVSYKKFQPELVEMEHAHIFHTVDSRGKKQTSCSAVGGHFHDVEVTVAADGSFHLICSEPYHIVTKTTKTGMTKKEKVHVSFEDGNNDIIIKDTHTHEFEYKGSEELFIGNRQNVIAPQGGFQPRPLPKEVEFKDA